MKKKDIKEIFIIALFIVVVLLIILCFCSNKFNNYEEKTNECNADSDCIPASCCHASSCINAENAPKCDGIFCTMECASNTLDCGQGSCKCKNNKCSADFNSIGEKRQTE